MNLFVVVEAFHLFGCRSLTHSAWRIGLFTNPWVTADVTVQAIAQLAVTHLPGTNTLFGNEPIGAGVWLRILAIAAAASLGSVDKRLRRAA